VLLGLLPLAAAGIVASRRSVEWFIALRYLVAKRRQVFISAITAICIGGIAAGVWLIIVVLSVMNGFERTWREEILGNRAHLVVHSRDGEIPDYAEVVREVREVPGVVAASPYLEADGMVRGRDGDIFSVVVRGIDPAGIGAVTDIESDLIVGSLDALARGDGASASEPEAGLPGVVLGNQLAVTLGVAVGDALLLVSPFGGVATPLGPAPRLERFRVAGVYQTSFFQYDEVYTYVDLRAAQDFRRTGDVVDGIEVRAEDFYRSQAVGAAIAERLGEPFFARDWKEFFPAFFQALRTERVMMFVLLTMIMVVAAFLIVATLVMMIMEKSSDIAILKAMGAEDEAIERIFAIEGTLIGLAGTAIGLVAGIAVTHQLGWIQDRIEMVTGIDALPATVYQFSSLPSEVDPLQVALVAAIAMILSLGATLLPSRQGAALDPAEGLRYE
jgi:lipoprotein-releasing system permease protein